MNPKRTACRYLEGQPGGKYACIVKRDRLRPPDIPQWVYDYWLKECLPFPDPNRPAHVPPIYHLPKGCGFRMVRVDGE